MITVTVADKPKVDPAKSLSALRARQTMATKAGDADKAADYGTQIRQLLEENPKLAEAKPTKASRPKKAKAEAKPDNPRGSLAALRAIRSRHVKSGNDDGVKDLDKRIAALIAAHPGLDAPKAKPKSETKDDDGEVDRGAVLAVLEREQGRLTTEVDRILRRQPITLDRQQRGKVKEVIKASQKKAA